jgi:hypothetical protein
LRAELLLLRLPRLLLLRSELRLLELLELELAVVSESLELDRSENEVIESLSELEEELEEDEEEEEEEEEEKELEEELDEEEELSELDEMFEELSSETFDFFLRAFLNRPLLPFDFRCFERLCLLFLRDEFDESSLEDEEEDELLVLSSSSSPSSSPSSACEVPDMLIDRLVLRFFLNSSLRFFFSFLAALSSICKVEVASVSVGAFAASISSDFSNSGGGGPSMVGDDVGAAEISIVFLLFLDFFDRALESSCT